MEHVNKLIEQLEQKLAEAQSPSDKLKYRRVLKTLKATDWAVLIGDTEEPQPRHEDDDDFPEGDF